MNIAFTGAQGTGKSTLVETLLESGILPDHKRYVNPQRLLHNYLGDKFPHSSKANDLSQIGIYSNFVIQLLGGNLICDRSLIDALAYSALAEGVKNHEELEEIFSKGLELYDIIFYTPIEFKVEEDGFRDTREDYIKSVDLTIQKYINKYQDKIRVVRVSGTVEERMKIILESIKSLKETE